MNSMYARMETVSKRLAWAGLQHRSAPVAMMDRMAGNGPVDPVRVLAQAVEAKGLGTGRSARKITTLTPLNRLVDAVPPESETVRLLEQAAERVAANPAASAADIALLRGYFGQWAAHEAAFQRVAQDNAILLEVQPLSHDLAGLGTTGLRTLDYLRGGKPAPAGWAAARTRELARFDKPTADLTLAAVRPVRVLLARLTRPAKAK
jgi:hexosaminidase